MPSPLLSNPTDLQLSHGDPAIGAIQTRVHTCARLQLQYVFIFVQDPDSGECRVEMTNDRLHASAQNLAQVCWICKGSDHVSPDTRMAYQCFLRPFPVFDVERSHIPSIDPSLLV